MPRHLRFESLERRRCLTTWGFAEHVIDLRSSTEDAQVADLNGDGRDDLVVSLSSGIGIRLAKTNEFGLQEARTVTIEGQAVGIADVDGDGDLDIVGSGQNLFWLENQNAAARFVRHELDESVPMEDPSPQLFQSGDVNGDGKLDWVYLATSQQLVTVLNATDPTIAVTNANVTANQVRQIQLLDATGDSAQEVMLGGVDLWYRWSGENLVPLAIPTGLGNSDVNLRRTYVDLDQNGLIDVIDQAPFDGITIYELQPDRSRFEKRQETEQITFPQGVALGDYNGDGRTDIFLGIITGGGGEGLEFRVMTQSPFGHFELSERLYGHRAGDHGNWQVADIGGTGRDDFLYFHSDGGISSGSATFTNLVRAWHQPTWIGSGDLDNDGDLDLVTSADYDYGVAFVKQSLLWYENLDGRGTFGSPNTLVQDRTSTALRPTGNWNQIVDWDHDGLLDIVCQWSGELFWYKNLGSAQRFAEPQTLASTKSSEALDFEIADLDGDGLLELLAHTDRPVTLVKFEQLPGSTSVGAAEPIASSIQPFDRLQAADLNNDGKPDVVAIQRTGASNTVVWRRNLGDGTLDASIPIGGPDVLSYGLADYDHDGDLDLFMIERSAPEQFRIYLNSGIGVFVVSLAGPAKTKSLASSIQLGDLDRDGDLDVLTVANAGVYFFENEAGQFSQPVMHWTTSSTPTVHLADVNGDGQLDWVSGATHTEAGLRWHQKRLIGDANGDGIFNSSDLIELFVINQFEDSIIGNSTFQTGDFNGDGEFNSTDLLLAFQAGAYTL